MRKRIGILLFILILAVGGLVSFAADKRTAKVVELHGKVEVQAATSEKKIAAFKNMVIREGDKIITGKDSKIVMSVDGDKEVTLAANTIAILSELKGGSAANDTVITIQAGGVGSKIEKKLEKDSSYKIKTPTAVMGVRGTHFYVQVETPEKGLLHPEVNIWLAEGTIEVEYRKEGSNISKYTKNEGELTSFLMTAPKKFDFPSEGRVPTAPEDFELKGLYKEFIDPDDDDLSELYDKDEIEKAKKEAEEEEEKEREEEEKDKDKDKDKDDSSEGAPYYEEIQDEDKDDDDKEGDDDDDDDEEAYIPPRPSGNYVYIGKYTVAGSLVPGGVEYKGELNRWVPFDIGPDHYGRVNMERATGNNVLNDAVFKFTLNEAGLRNYIWRHASLPND